MQVFAGFFVDMAAGNVTAGADLGIIPVMAAFSFDADSINIADGTLDEFDGVGYSEYDVAGVAVGYLDADDAYYIDGTTGAGDEFGSLVAAGSGDIIGFVLKRRVDGTDANDVIWGFNDDGNYPQQANGGTLGLTVPDDHLLKLESA